MTLDKKIKLLLIEDEELQRNLITTVLRAGNFDIVGEAENGGDGLEQFQKTNPDITLLDIQLPDISGIDCLKRILDTNPKACVLMLSSNDRPDTIEKCLDAGAYNFISKVTPAIELGLKVKALWKNFQDR